MLGIYLLIGLLVLALIEITFPFMDNGLFDRAFIIVMWPAVLFFGALLFLITKYVEWREG